MRGCFRGTTVTQPLNRIMFTAAGCMLNVERFIASSCRPSEPACSSWRGMPRQYGRHFFAEPVCVIGQRAAQLPVCGRVFSNVGSAKTATRPRHARCKTGRAEASEIRRRHVADKRITTRRDMLLCERHPPAAAIAECRLVDASFANAPPYIQRAAHRPPAIRPA